MFPLDHFETLRGIVGGKDLIPLALQNHRSELENDFLVIHHQYPFNHDSSAP